MLNKFSKDLTEIILYVSQEQIGQADILFLCILQYIEMTI